MKLTEMLGQYEELLDKKDQLAKDTKDNNAAIDKLKAEIAEMMIDEDIPSQGYGDYIYSLQDKVDESMKDFLRILPTEDDAKAVEAASSLKNAATGLVLQATKLAAQADRIMHDLYDEVSSYTTPVEDYLEGQFEDAEADPEAEAEEEQEDAE